MHFEGQLFASPTFFPLWVCRRLKPALSQSRAAGTDSGRLSSDQLQIARLNRLTAFGAEPRQHYPSPHRIYKEMNAVYGRTLKYLHPRPSAVCHSRDFDPTSGSLPAPMIAKLVTRRILREHTTCNVVLGVEISDAADESRFDTRKGGTYSG